MTREAVSSAVESTEEVLFDGSAESSVALLDALTDGSAESSVASSDASSLPALSVESTVVAIPCCSSSQCFDATSVQGR